MNRLLHETEATNAVLMEQITVRTFHGCQHILEQQLGLHPKNNSNVTLILIITAFFFFFYNFHTLFMYFSSEKLFPTS